MHGGFLHCEACHLLGTQLDSVPAIPMDMTDDIFAPWLTASRLPAPGKPIYPATLNDLLANYSNQPRRTVLAGNSAKKRGGAIMCAACHVVVLHQTDVVDNVAKHGDAVGSGGGLYAGAAGTESPQYGLLLVIVDGKFTGNQAAGVYDP